jgi:hypothetical protein
MAADTTNDWFVQALRRGPRRAPLTPPEEWRAIKAELADAKAAGDQERIEAAGAELNRLAEEAQEAERAELAEGGALIRASAGVRRPIRRELPPGQRMDQLLLVATGRLEPRRGRYI